MIEWEFAEERALPGLHPEPEPRRTWSGRQQAALFLLAALLFAVVGGTVWRTVQRREKALRADLEAAVLAEERARAFGQTHQLPQLVVSDAPAGWSQAYAAHFANNTPVDTALSDVSFDDQAALVTLVVTPTSGTVLAPHLEARFYRFDGTHWKRAPLPAERWGRHATLTVEPFFVVSYRSRDSAFAHELASDMQRLAARVTRQWGHVKQPTEFRVDIIPQELSGPLFYRQAEHVAVNSPSLAIPFSSILTPEDEIRVAVGQVLVQGLTEEAPVALLRHRENARLVLAALRRAEVRHALLSPTALAAYQAQRRAELADGWIAPLITAAAYGPSIYPDTIRAQNSADLLADYVVASYGPDGLARLARAVQDEATWDQVLQQAFGTDMHSFLAAARDFGLGVAAGERPSRWSPADGERARGVAATIVEVSHSGAPLVLRVETEETPTPIQVWLRDAANLEDVHGAPFPPECLAAGLRLSVSGDWVSYGQRLHATRIEVTESSVTARAVSSVSREGETNGSGEVGTLDGQQPHLDGSCWR